MNGSVREYLPGALNGITGIAVVTVSIFLDTRFNVPLGVTNIIGMSLLALGMAIALWATTYLKSAILGEVQPRLSVLVKEGPFRFVRHPVSVGITLALLGVTIIRGNWFALLILLMGFVPTVIYRATLEEKALVEKFGDEWQSYATQTGFMLPRRRRLSS